MSTKDEIFNNYNTVVKKINSLNYDDYLKKAQERVAVNKEAEVNAANSAYNATKENAQNASLFPSHNRACYSRENAHPFVKENYSLSK